MTELENIKQRIAAAKNRIDSAINATQQRINENEKNTLKINAVKQELDDAIMDLESYIKGDK